MAEADAEDENQLVKKRGRVRAIVTRYINMTEASMDKAEIDKLQHLRETLKEKKSYLDQLNESIHELIEEDDLTDDINTSIEYNVRINDVLKRIDLYLKKNNVSHTQSVACIKLPKIDLPKFSGNKMDFSGFWDIFNAAIMSNSTLSNVQKFAYLLSCLTGEAKSSLSGLSLNNENFELAIRLLTDKFGNKDSIIREHLGKLQNCKSPTATAASLKQFFYEIAMHTRCLENLGKPAEKYETMLMPILIHKLPEEIRLRILSASDKYFQNVYSLDGFNALLQKEIAIREECKENFTSNSRLPCDKSDISTFKSLSQSSSSAIALPTVGLPSEKRSNSKTEMKKPAKFCVYCDSIQHYSSECSTVCDRGGRVEHLKETRRCFICLRKFHDARNCRNRRKCSKCHKFHHVSICPQVEHKVETDAKREPPTVSLFVQGSRAVILPSAKVILRSAGGREMRVRLLLDQCSTRTFIRKDICVALGISSEGDEQLAVNTFGSESPSLKSCGRVRFTIMKIGGSEEVHLSANMVETICSPQPSFQLSSLTQFTGLDDDLADEYDPRDGSLPISILVGADFYHDIVTDQVVRGSSGPVAISSRLGWLASGVLMSNDIVASSNSVQEVDCFHLSASFDLQKFWSLEHLGISSTEDDNSDIFLSQINYDTEKSRYSIKLPWKLEKDDILLNSNFDLSMRRLNSTLRHLRASPQVLTEYERILQDQLQKKIIEPAPDYPTGSVVHYLPHHPVVKPHAESTKVRIVLDASAKGKKNQTSLNDCMEKGPCLLPHIPILLIKFRLHNIAILADIEKAFLQIGISECDRDALRILWTDEPWNPQSDLKIYRYTALIFGLKSSPAILDHVIRLHLEKFQETDPELIARLKTEFYVDNLVSGAETVQEAKELFAKTRDIFKAGHFNLRQWKSNNAQFVDYAKMQMEDRDNETESTFASDINSNVPECHAKVLGVQWDTVEDKFIIDLTFLQSAASSNSFTKRELLQITSRIYDPMGFLSPVMILPKLLFQKICSSKQSWDSPLEADVDLQWKQWLQEISRLKLIIPRCIFNSSETVDQVTLHGFSDASSVSYAAAVYIRICYSSGRVECFLLMAKSRIVPKANPQSIPRLELMGAVILARLLAYLKPIFPSIAVFCWCDSRNVLFWISQKHKLWKTFVQNRVCEIRTLVPSACWRFLPGSMNPSDLATRPIRPTALQERLAWFSGPDWLLKQEEDWPRSDDFVECVTCNSVSVEVEQESFSHNEATDAPSLLNVINVSNYSSYSSLLRVCAYLFRISSRLHGQRAFQSLELTASEIKNAEVRLLLALQARDFQKEISHLKNGTASTNLTKQLHLFLDEKGLLRSRGRLPTCLTAESNCPILLPRHEHFSSIIVNSMHDQILHGGVSATLAKLREKFWLIHGRQVVKKILRKCVWCKRINGLPYQVPPVPDLPEFRAEQYRAFETVGLDYCGPVMYGKGEDGQTSKSYICLFTCASTRAIHLELVPNLSTEGFLRALRRFTSRRGIPAIVSDNFSSFKKAFNDLNAISMNSEVRRHVSEKRIQWHFIIEHSPWQGGFYERLVKDVKDSLKKSLKFSLVEFEELQTIVVEIEAVLNSRPLCYVSAEREEVITPSHFLILRRHTAAAENALCSEMNLLKRLKGTKRLLDRFWRIWLERYLLSLRERHSKNPTYRSSCTKPASGDVVVIKENKPRLRWKMGQVISCSRGRDGFVRSATVRVLDSKNSPVVIRRPIRLLIPLELSEVDHHISDDTI